MTFYVSYKMNENFNTIKKREVCMQKLDKIINGFPVYFVEESDMNKAIDLSDPVAYIVAGNGMFVFTKHIIFNSITHASNVGIPSLKNSIKLTCEKIPMRIFNVIKSFFKKIYEHHKSEAFGYLQYNYVTKDWIFDVVDQEVSAAGVDYKEKTQLNGYTVVGTFHSHGGMSAFASGIDKHDEINFPGIHGVIGKIQNIPEVHLELINGKERFSVLESDIIEGSIPDIEVPIEWLNKVKVKVYNTMTPVFGGFNYPGIYDNDNIWDVNKRCYVKKDINGDKSIYSKDQLDVMNNIKKNKKIQFSKIPKNVKDLTKFPKMNFVK